MASSTSLPAVLFTEDEILGRVRELGADITRDYARRPPVLVSLLKGGIVFLADLFREIDLPVRVDMMSISSYVGGEHVILVEDIIDTGLSLSYLLASLRGREPASLEVCTLLDKDARRIAPLEIRYRGFDCPDRFVVGYGLDHGQRYRNLPFIVAIDRQRSGSAEGDETLSLLDRAVREGHLPPRGGLATLSESP